MREAEVLKKDELEVEQVWAQRPRVTPKKIKDTIAGLSFLSLNITGFLAFTLLPVLASLVLAFTRWDILTPPVFVGFQNFWDLIHDKYFWKYFINTLIFMTEIPLGMAVSLGLALAMNQQLKGIVIYRTIYFLPVVCNLVAVAMVWRWIYNPDFGLLNAFLRAIGISNPPNWLSSTFWAKPAIIIMDVWKGAGYNMLLYLAALQGIPQTLYEAADIDGASAWQKFWRITMPMLMPTHFFIIVMGVIGGFQAFGAQYVMTGGGPAGSTTTIVYYIYNNAFRWFKMGYASSIAWFLFLMMFGITVLQFRFAGEKAQIAF